MIGGIMKKFLWVAFALSLLAVSSQAQQIPAADVSAGYSYFRVGGSGGANLNGFSTSAAYDANSWFAVVGDLGVYHGSPSGVGVTALTYTFGPRFSIRKSDKIVPFAQALFGGSHISASFGGFSGSTNPFAYSLGGGAEVPLGSRGKVALRPEVEYFGLRSNGGTSNCVRVSIGIVYHIGER
jgi:outer membrane immunogenic protein